VSRIPPVNPEQLSPEQRKIYDAIAAGPRGRVVGPFLALLHAPELTNRVQQLGEYLRYKTGFTPALNELAIIVTARHNNAPYEFHAHALLALAAGVSQRIVDAVAARRRPESMDPDQALVHDYALEINVTRTASDDIYAKVLQRFGTTGIVELTVLCGYYTLMAMTLNAHQVPLPEGVKPAW